MIQDIRRKFARGEFELAQHALDQLLGRNIFLTELLDAIPGAEVIEDYPHDKYWPSCLLLSLVSAGQPLHVHVTYPSRPLIKVVTLYHPNPDRWINFRERRK